MRRAVTRIGVSVVIALSAAFGVVSPAHAATPAPIWPSTDRVAPGQSVIRSFANDFDTNVDRVECIWVNDVFSSCGVPSSIAGGATPYDNFVQYLDTVLNTTPGPWTFTFRYYNPSDVVDGAPADAASPVASYSVTADPAGPEYYVGFSQSVVDTPGETIYPYLVAPDSSDVLSCLWIDGEPALWSQCGALWIAGMPFDWTDVALAFGANNVDTATSHTVEYRMYAADEVSNDGHALPDATVLASASFDWNPAQPTDNGSPSDPGSTPASLAVTGIDSAALVGSAALGAGALLIGLSALALRRSRSSSIG